MFLCCLPEDDFGISASPAPGAPSAAATSIEAIRFGRVFRCHSAPNGSLQKHHGNTSGLFTAFSTQSSILPAECMNLLGIFCDKNVEDLLVDQVRATSGTCAVGASLAPAPKCERPPAPMPYAKTLPGAS